MADDDVLEWPSDTEEFMEFTVTAPVDPLDDDVFVAITPKRQDRTLDDFVAAEWVPGQAWLNKTTPLVVRRLIPAGTIANKKVYKTAVRITDSPTRPVIEGGLVKGVL